MSDQCHDLTSLVAAVQQLEAQNSELRRAIRTLWLLLGGLTIVGIAGGATLQRTGRFEKAVEIVDGAGTLRAVLFADYGANRSGLELRDPEGRSRMTIHTHRNGDSLLQMFDKRGQNRMEMGFDDNGNAHFHMRNGRGALVHELDAPF